MSHARTDLTDGCSLQPLQRGNYLPVSRAILPVFHRRIRFMPSPWVIHRVASTSFYCLKALFWARLKLSELET